MANNIKIGWYTHSLYCNNLTYQEITHADSEREKNKYNSNIFYGVDVSEAGLIILKHNNSR